MTRVYAVLAAGVVAMFVSAGARADSVKMTLGQAVEAYAGLHAFDGYEKVIKEGDKERVIRQPFALGGQVRLAIAKDMLALKAVVDQYNAARDGLILELSGGTGSLKDGTPEANKFIQQETELRKMPATVEVAPLKAEDLKLDSNSIAPTALAQVDVLLAK